VGGLNAGGRGYYALDITVPTAPTLLWEFTTAADKDVGYSYGQPIVTRKADGTWVVLVTSGYDNGTLSGDSTTINPINNSPAGNGQGYLYVLNAITGAITSKISTGVGSATTPSGLAKIAAWNNEPAGNQAGYVYGGDLMGNVWRFDINSTVAATIGTGDVMKFATLFSDTAGTQPQPITTTPVLGLVAGKRVIFVGTGQYLGPNDLNTTQLQTQYAIKDDNATATLVNPRKTLVKQTITSAGSSRTVSNNLVNFYTGNGWYVDFPDGGTSTVGSERVNIDSKLVQGTLLVPTIVPSNTDCSPGGYGWLNFFNFQTGSSVNTTTSLVSTKYDATIVGINVIYIDAQPKVGVVTSNNPTPTLDTTVLFSAGVPSFAGKRVIWRELIP
jgi:type IV pilus assembly protein PilY1